VGLSISAAGSSRADDASELPALPPPEAPPTEKSADENPAQGMPPEPKPAPEKPASQTPPKVIKVPPRLSEEPPPARVWYGGPILAFDAGAILVGHLGSVAAGNGWPSLIGAGIFVTAGPIMHLRHGSPQRALISFGLRTVGPLATTLLGVVFGVGAYQCNSNCDGPLGTAGAAVLGGFVGFELGLAGASVADTTWLAFDEPQPASPRAAYTLAPLFTVATDSAKGRVPIAGVAGAF
jgi:hypothetical protein